MIQYINGPKIFIRLIADSPIQPGPPVAHVMSDHCDYSAPFERAMEEGELFARYLSVSPSRMELTPNHMIWLSEQENYVERWLTDPKVRDSEHVPVGGGRVL